MKKTKDLMPLCKETRYEKLQKKDCVYCHEEYKGTGKSKFCSDFCSTSFQKEKSKNIRAIAKIKAATSNFKLTHKQYETTKYVRKCDCCGEEYEFIVFPKTFIYPKYCELHRNLYRRERYKNNLTLDTVSK